MNKLKILFKTEDKITYRSVRFYPSNPASLNIQIEAGLLY